MTLSKQDEAQEKFIRCQHALLKAIAAEEQYCEARDNLDEALRDGRDGMFS
jgi:hypothetical protein